MHTEPASTTRAEVMAVLDRRIEACRAKDIGQLMAVYAPDIVYFDVIPPRQFAGTEDVRANFMRWFGETPGDIGLETRELHLAAGGQIAFAHMLHPNSGPPGSGQDAVVWVRATVCLQRIDGEWLITHEHVSVPISPATGSPAVQAAH